MDKSELAKQLRECQLSMGLVDPEVVNLLPDEAMIVAYTTCSCCGELFAPPDVIEVCIRNAKSAEHFLKLLKEASDSHAHVKRGAENGHEEEEGYRAI